MHVSSADSNMDLALFNLDTDLLASKLINPRVEPNKHDFHAALVWGVVDVVSEGLVNRIALHWHVLVHLRPK